MTVQSRPHARRARHLLPRDRHGVRRAGGRRGADAARHAGRRARQLPARGLRGGRPLLRAVRDRRGRRLRERPAGVHRERPDLGEEVRRRGRADRRRRHQEPGRRHDHPPRAREALRGPRRRARPDLPAELRRQHGLQEHARARAPDLEEDLEDPVGAEPARGAARQGRASTSARATTCRGSRIASGR